MAKMQIEQYKEEKGISQSKKIFAIFGGYNVLRKGMKQRGWAEHKWYDEEDSDGKMQPMKSLAFDFLYTLKASHIYRIPLAPHQQVNHIFG